MRKFAQKQNQSQQISSVNLAGPGKAKSKLSDTTHPVLQLQRTVGNQAVLRMLDWQEQKTDATLFPTTVSRFGHDFSRIPINNLVQENNSDYSHRDMVHSDKVNLPTAGESGEIVDEPQGGVTDQGPSLETNQTEYTCDRPLSMRAVTSGSFEGGLTMASYYPDLAGRGFWQHGGTAGTWGTGTRVGANVQLIGSFQIPCRPNLYQFAQTVTYTRARFNGVRHPKEGVPQDDIAKSGRDFTRPPARQDWFNNISIADPPSIPYTATSNVEFDRSFATSLVGPGGRRSVNWSTSIRIVKGRVTRNNVS